MLHVKVREKILEAHENGVSVKEIWRAYCVGKTAEYALLKLERETGNIKPRTYLRGRKATLCRAELARIEAMLQIRKQCRQLSEEKA